VLGERPAGGVLEPVGVLLDLVEHDHGVVERETENGQQADDRRRRDLEAHDGIHTGGDDEVEYQRGQRGEGHVALVPDGDVQRRQRQEHHQGDESLVGDLPAPGLRHRRVADRVLVGLAVGAPWLERVEERRAQLFDLRVVQRLRADLHRGRIAAADEDHRFGCLAEGLAEHVFDLLGGDVAGCGLRRHGDLGATLEVDAEREAANQNARDGDGDDQTADREPELALADDLERAGSGVQPREEAVPRRCGAFEVWCLDGFRREVV
jgi:hypothetical protein